jgi:hypothetical protein
MAKKPAKRVRDAGTGKIVAASEAQARPKETVVEKVGSADKRLDLIESVIEEAGGPLARLLRRRRAGLSD